MLQVKAPGCSAQACQPVTVFSMLLAACVSRRIGPVGFARAWDIV